MEKSSNKDFHELLLKAERFCAYQERCSSELKQKLRELGADEEESAKIISSLQEDDYLNDERFAQLFTSGKFRIKRWGKNKIRGELKRKNISDKFISAAFDLIDKAEYLKVIEHLAKKKEREVKGKSPSDKKQKIGMFLLSRGFESELIWKCINLKI